MSLPSTLLPGLVQPIVGASDNAVRLLPDFVGAEVEADCLFQPEGGLLTLAFPVVSVALQGIGLELLEYLEAIQ